MFEVLFKNVTEEDKDKAIANIIEHATPRQDFFVMMVLSVAMAAFGLLLDSVVILIGSMLVAPLLYPLLSMSVGVITTDGKLIGRSFYTILKSSAWAVAASFVIGLLFSSSSSATLSIQILSTDHSSLMYAIVAAIAGFAAAFAITKPHLNDTLPGVAISVALVPPLALIGVGISTLDWASVSNAFLLYLVNIIGILFSSMIVFSLFKFAVKKKVTEKVVIKEEKVIKEEIETIEKEKEKKGE